MSILNDFRDILDKLEKKYELKGSLVYNREKGLVYHNLDIPIKLKITDISNNLELIKRLEKAHE